LKKQIEQALEQLVCVGPMNHIPKKIPLVARAIEKSFVIVVCNKLDKVMRSTVDNRRQGPAALVAFKKDLMAEYTVSYTDLVDESIKVESHG